MQRAKRTNAWLSPLGDITKGWFSKECTVEHPWDIKGWAAEFIGRLWRQRILSQDSTTFQLCNTTPPYWPPVWIYLNTSNKKQTYDRHPLAYVVEVKNGEQTVGDGSAHLCGSDGSGSAGAKHKAKVSGRSHKSALIWRLSLVNQLAWREMKRKAVNRQIFAILGPDTRHAFLSRTLTLLLTHDGVAERQKAEKIVGVVVPDLHRLQQGVVVEAEVWIRQRVEGSEVQPLEGNRWSTTGTVAVACAYCANGCLQTRVQTTNLWRRSQWVGHLTWQ